MIRNTSIRLSSSHVLVLIDCLLLPNGHENIMSIPLLVKENNEFSSRNNVYDIYYKNKLVGTNSLVNDLDYLKHGS